MNTYPAIKQSEISNRLLIAEKVAHEGGALALSYFKQGNISVRSKKESAFDPVTKADIETEKLMRRIIKEYYPQDAILGEELGESGQAQFKWTIDPIDGTLAFISGSPLWGTLVGISLFSQPVAGIIAMPTLNQQFVGDVSKQVTSTRSCPDIKMAIAASTSPYMFASSFELRAFTTFSRSVLGIRFGGDCYNYAMLSVGLLDIVFEASLKPEDVHAIIPIVKSSGGTITTWTGEDPQNGGCIVATGDTHIHKQVLSLISTLY